MRKFLFEGKRPGGEGEGFTVDANRVHVDAICPFCAGTYTAGYTTDGDPILLHSLPECGKFVRLDINEFLEAARKAGAVPIGGGPDRN